MVRASIVAALALAGLAPEAAAKTYVFKIATVAPEGTPWAVALKKYRRIVHKKTSKQVKVKVFLGGTLGDENETVLACKRGQIQGVGVSTGAMATLVPELNVLEMPYLFRSAKEADKVLDSDVVRAEVERLLGERGFILLFFTENGFRSFGTKDGFVKSPADLAGKRMRAQESDVHDKMYRAFGASPKGIAVTEVLNSLQTNNVDGFDNTPLFAMAASWHTAIKYYTVSNHIYQPALVAVRKEWFDALPPELRQAMLDARGNIPKVLRRQLRRMTPLLLKQLEEHGVQVYKLSKKEKKSFYPAAKIARKQFLESAGESTRAFYQVIRAALKKVRGG